MPPSQFTHHPMEALDPDSPVTVGMLRDSIEDAGQAIGFVLGAALQEAGLSLSQRARITLQLKSLTEQAPIYGPAFDALVGVVFGINAHLQEAPDSLGKR